MAKNKPCKLKDVREPGGVMDSESKEKVDIEALQHELEMLRKEYLYTLRKMLERAHLHDSSVLELKVNKSERLSLVKEIEQKSRKINSLQHSLDSIATELKDSKNNCSSLMSANADLLAKSLVKDRKIEAFEVQCSSLTSAYKEKSKEAEAKKLNTTRLESKLNVMKEDYAVIERENYSLKKQQMVVAEELSALKIDSEKNLVKLNERRNQLRLTTIQFHALQNALYNKKRQKRNLEKVLQQAKSEHDLTINELSNKRHVITMLMGQIASMSNEIALMKSSLTEAQSKIVWLRDKNRKQEDDLALTKSSLSEAQSEIVWLRDKNRKQEDDLALTKSSLSEAQSEIVWLRDKNRKQEDEFEVKLQEVNNDNLKLARQYEKKLISNTHKINSLQRENSVQLKQLEAQRIRFNELAVNALERRKNYKISLWNKLLVFLNPRKRKLLKQIEIISQSEYFDAEWYLRNNLDVAYSSLDPIEHFILFGANEGRDPSPKFSCKCYCSENPDVAQSNVNPLIHYLKHGIKEERKFSG